MRDKFYSVGQGMKNSDNIDTPAGLAFAVSAYLLWGILPLYIKLLDHIPTAEIVAHRVVWSVPIAGLALVALGRTADIRAALVSPSTLAMGALMAALVSINWGIYIWAIGSCNTLDAALGYYINPLFSIALGALFLGERPNSLQMVSIALASGAVLILILAAGKVPWAAIGLFVSWGLYTLCKKKLPVGPNQGFLLEVLILMVPALTFISWLSLNEKNHFFTESSHDGWLLLGCGAVTAIPLMLYANSAKKLRMTTIAILQYIAPTMIFLCAIFVFNEPLEKPSFIAFPMIWAALLIYSISLISPMRKDCKTE